MCMAACCKYECKLPVLVINTLRMVACEKLSYLFEIMVGHSSNSTAASEVNCELSWLNYLFCFDFRNMNFSRQCLEIEGYHTAGGWGVWNLLPLGSAFHVSFIMSHLTHWSLRN